MFGAHFSCLTFLPHIVRTVSRDKVYNKLSPVSISCHLASCWNSVLYSQHTTFIVSESVRKAAFAFSLSSKGGARTAVSKTSSSFATVCGRGWTAFGDEPATNGTWRLIDELIAARIDVCFSCSLAKISCFLSQLWYLGILPRKPWWTSNLGDLLGLFTTLRRKTRQELIGVPVSLSSFNTKKEGMVFVTWNVSTIECGSDPNTNRRAPPTQYIPNASQPAVVRRSPPCTDDHRIWGC